MEQTRGSMNKKRIGGGAPRASERNIAKPISVEGRSRRSDDRAWKAVGLIAGDLRRVGNPIEFGSTDWGGRETS